MGALEALERNDISRLPGGIFSRAFVRSYASEVGLDPEATIQEFIAQFPQDSVTAGHPTSTTRPKTTGDRERSADGDDVPAARLAEHADGGCGALLRHPAASRRAGPRDVAPAPLEPPPAPRAAPPPAADGPAPRATAGNVPADELTVALSASGQCWVSATVDGERRSTAAAAGRAPYDRSAARDGAHAGDASALADAQRRRGEAARQQGEVVTARLNLTNFKDYVQPGERPTPLLDFFKRGEVERDVRLQAAQGTLAPRAHEQLAILVLLLEDPDPEIRHTPTRR